MSTWNGVRARLPALAFQLARVLLDEVGCLAVVLGRRRGDSRDRDVPADPLRKSLLRNAELRAALNRAWPLLDAADLVADLWSVPAYL
ncbi:MAG: hypothetical protein ACRDNZ_22860, partial [Streptosporangiaceae bacterium]